MGRNPCCPKEGLNRGAWTAEEDEILVSYMRSHGEGKWRNLPKRAGLNKCGKSCRLRWLNYLRPDIKRGNISEQEEDLIIRLHKLLGNRWSLIAGRLLGRTDNEIKNYWNTTLWRKIHGRSTGAPKPKRETKDKQRKPSEEKLLAEAPPQLPALPEETAEDGATGTDPMRSGKYAHWQLDAPLDGGQAKYVHWQLDAPLDGGQATSSAAMKSSAGSGEPSQVGNTSDDLMLDLDLIEDMYAKYPLGSNSLLVTDGEEAPNSERGMAAGDEENNHREPSMPDSFEDVLGDGAALEDWLKADLSQLECSSDFQFVASFLDLEEWL